MKNLISSRKKHEYLTTAISPNADKERFYGCVDVVSEGEISGWVTRGDGNSEEIILEVLLDDFVVATASPNFARIDLALMMEKSIVEAGFKVDTHDDLDDSEITIGKKEKFALTVRIKGTSHYLRVPKAAETISLKKFHWTFKKQTSSQKKASKPISLEQCKATFESLENPNIFPESKTGVKLIAYYLPQFHPIPENDEWWGQGFTEWTNVSQAVPYFKDHYQPHVPGELGYYDLRLPEIREAQAKLAAEYGIYGFCYYYYWFEGRRLLERPLQEVFESGKPDFPFCICWANENWSRRWDGSENEILVQQVHNEKTDEAFIHDVIPLFKDPRYIKINGAPLLIIYRISLMPNPVKTTEKWRKICAENDIPNIHICMAETFGLTEPRQYGFDSSVQFPPHNMVAGLENDKIEDLPKDYTGNIYDFEKVIKYELAKELTVYKQFPGVMTAWDNTARKKKAGNIFINATPETYEIWLRGAIDRAKQTLPEGEQLVFINAWNEWAEGTHLEPDRKNGRTYLEATRRALIGHSDWRSIMHYAQLMPELSGEAKKNFLADMNFAFEHLAKVNEHFLGILGNYGLPKWWTHAKPGLPANWTNLNIVESGGSWLDTLNHYKHCTNKHLVIDSYQKMYVEGWAYHDDKQTLKSETPTYIILKDIDSEETYYAPMIYRTERADVASHKKNQKLLYSGIKALIDISQVPVGNYHLNVACRLDKRVLMTPFKVEVEIA